MVKKSSQNTCFRWKNEDSPQIYSKARLRNAANVFPSLFFEGDLEK